MLDGLAWCDKLPIRKNTLTLRPSISDTDPQVSRIICRFSKLVGLEWTNTRKKSSEFAFLVVVRAGCNMYEEFLKEFVFVSDGNFSAVPIITRIS